MCTSIRYRKGDFYFGRNLDVNFSFGEKVVITPRHRLFHLTDKTDYRTDYALIGMAAVMQDTPLYYEAANEKGLCMAGLNFPKNAVYHSPVEGKDNIALFELIPWILGQAKTVGEAEELLRRINLTDTRFMNRIPSTPLHFMIGDREKTVVAEPMADGMKLYDNPYGVLTNNPPFDYHRWNMQNYLNLDKSNRENSFSKEYPLENYGVGMGALGLPGDASSASRFVRAAFHLTNSESDGTEADNVTQFFHVLDSVAMLRGSTKTDDGKNDFTLYSCCINADQGIYYYKTYTDSRIHGVSMQNVDLDGPDLYLYDMITEQSFSWQN